MSTPMPQPAHGPDQAELERHFLAALRQRFKAEVNRLTGGDMRRRLADQPDGNGLSFPLSYVYAFHWLRRNVPAGYRRAVLAPFRNPLRAFLMDLLDESDDAAGFVQGYIRHLGDDASNASQQRRELLRLLAAHGHSAARLAERVLDLWNGLGLPDKPYAEAYSELGRAERNRYAELLGPEDRERLALVDALPDPGGAPARFAKLGVIPAMGCPQTCRHCMFIWRPPMGNTPDPEALLQLVASHTDSVLFTGGDLSRHLHRFVRAIRTMRQVRTFAILLNGDFADDGDTANRTLKEMAAAVRERPKDWPEARVVLQISFDEFHQEVVVDRKGELKERIPVAKIANIVECAPRYREIQLALLHKQNALNFSMDLFRQGVFARLAQELGRRGHQIQVLGTTPSPRTKRHPLDPEQMGPVVKDASFVLARFPERPILFTSSTIDAYGRATLLEPGEAVAERDLLRRVLDGAPPEGEFFDTDLMFWFNGWVTLFSSVYVCLGDLYRDGAETILARHRKDPLSAALRRFDRRLLELYREVRDDLNARIASATGPHQLFNALTEEAAVRLHMTRRLAAAPD